MHFKLLLNNTKTLKSNLLIVSGTGQNVGKTTFVCHIIQHFKKQGIIALKISPYWHNINRPEDIIIKNDNFLIMKESNTDGLKDSSKMLLSGAIPTFYIQAVDEFIPQAFAYLSKKYIKNKAVICESSALAKHYMPACHFVVTNDIKNKGDASDSLKIWVQNTDKAFDFDINNLILKDNKWLIKQ